MPYGLLISARPTVNPHRFNSEIRDEICAMGYTTDVEVTPDFASFAGVKAGAVDVLRYAGAGVQGGARTEKDIRLDRADYYLVCVPERAQLGVRHNGNAVELPPGSFALISTSRPFQATIRSTQDDRSFSTVYARVPGPMLRREIPNIEQLCGRALHVRNGASRAMLSLFLIALEDGPWLTDEERRGFGAILLSAVSRAAQDAAAVLATSPDPQLGARRILDRATAFIASRLADPELSPAEIAAHCGVSRRYLHAAFASLSAFSVSGHIRETRLQGCRSVLQNPAMNSCTITQIAGNWGFDDPSHFCHLYKSRFGKTPRHDRTADLETPRYQLVSFTNSQRK